MTTSAATHELEIRREFDAPPARLYEAFTDADQLAQWFGPVGFSVPRESVDIDARVGGHQRFVMVSDEDPDFTAPVNATFTEVIPDELLAGTQEFAGVAGLQEPTVMTMRTEFHAVDGGTRLVVRQAPHTREMIDMARAGWESSFTKLDTLLGA
jgi:uncharacterized protein YndB with AHSA1/START domain